MGKHWTEKLFIENASLFGARLEEMIEETSEEVEGLLNIFSEHHVKEKGKILDLACGMGRHSVQLAKKGYNTVGVDISPSYIKRAREYADEMGVSDKAEFIIGDMKKVGELLKDRKNSFDAAVNLFTSMGYWDEETDIQIFKQVIELTKLDGILVIHTVNRDYIIKNFQSRDITYGGKGMVTILERRLNLENSRLFNTWKYYREKDKHLEHLSTIELDHRIYSLHELKKLVLESGWRFQISYGNYQMHPLTTDTFASIIIAKKEDIG